MPVEQTTMPGKYRPMGQLLLNIGKDLISEIVFREIVESEDRWQESADAEKVLPNILKHFLFEKLGLSGRQFV